MTPRIRDALEWAGRPVAAAVLAGLLALPTLTVGFQLDDYVHRALVVNRKELSLPGTGSGDLFWLSTGEPGRIHKLMSDGIVPWWTDPELRLAFWRPISAWTHWMEYTLFPNDPVPMHAMNAILLAALTGMAALVYRRVIVLPWVAGLAALLYAIDHGHVLSASWISSRNTLLTALLALVTLWGHLRWRQDGASRLLPVGAFACALLSGEAGLAVLAYLAAHAIFLEKGPGPERARTLIPYGAVLAVWTVAYRLLGYGTSGSGMYLDPLREPLAYLEAALVRGPILLLGQWALPPAQLSNFYPRETATLVAGLALLASGIAGFYLCRILAGNRSAWFFGTGMLLALLPIAATLPSERLLLLAGLGAMGLVAQTVAAVFGDEPARAAGSAGSRGARALAVFLLIVHVPVSILLGLGSLSGYRVLTRLHKDGYEPVLREISGTRRTAVLLNPPCSLFSAYLGAMALERGSDLFRWRHLASGTQPVELERIDATTLRLRTAGGFVPEPGTRLVPDDASGPALDGRVLLQHLDSLYRSPRRPMRPGDKVFLDGLTVEIGRVDPEGLPLDALFHFEVPLDDPTLAWYAWQEGRLTAYTLPPPGEPAILEPVRVEF